MLIALVWVSAEAAELLAPPQQVVQQASDGLKGVLREDRARLADPGFARDTVNGLLLPGIDLGRASGLLLGPFWRDATQAQREGFERELKALVVRASGGALQGLGDWEIRYPPMRPGAGPGDLVVPVEVLRPGALPLSASLAMALDGGRWRVYDLAVEGISLLRLYRAVLVPLVRAEGLDGLIADLAAGNGVPGRRQTASGSSAQSLGLR
jgi:phospholipid transport system substrate-binding protein